MRLMLHATAAPASKTCIMMEKESSERVSTKILKLSTTTTSGNKRNTGMVVYIMLCVIKFKGYQLVSYDNLIYYQKVAPRSTAIVSSCF